ncbi:zf-HC2 domain-containing protein [Corallococcus exiguus]|uniref:zf-HC2 domain-containing protein n=1 Tax=Corallococcus TaxID=83461 RepID=UPI000ED26C96|nr:MULTISPECIES: zf-HC2 domain-containing protein [Corallococcus]NNB85370.1 zf-HC2 domain-containing protein [Corallococcus exiguus]NNB98216.1 zf-HC2 domain-containing protein [Corallococcus exiguus]NNC07240.1 zf-HC2 domain-containing protein [Corallococcus exiguus]NPC51148.1 zf-HC2 domain-containing protein [Corallococcus exiguus]RKH87160.1 zf-HC2 domain-containing protein [Corallococcus sp. AB032C]
MNAHCTRLHLFMDGELSESDAEGFRSHLPRCASCEGGLRDLLQLELLAARALGTGVAETPAAKPEGNVVSLGAWVRKNARVVAPLAMAASLCAVFVPRMMPAADMPAVVFLENQSTREMEARLADPRADHHRPYSPMRGGADGAETGKVTLPLRPLAEMEERKDFRGIVAAYVLHGQWQQAQAVLAREPVSLERNIDLSVVALQDGRYQDALSLLDDPVVRAEPGNPQALWNRGLAQRALGQKALAAAAFEQVAAMDEQGWSEEARDLAKGLREEARKQEKGLHDEAAR